MKICWNNLEGLEYNKIKNEWKKNKQFYIYKENCKNCNESFLTWKYKTSEYCCMSCAKIGKTIYVSKETRLKMSKRMKGNKLSKKTKEKISNTLKKLYKNKKNHPSWKGGYNLKKIPIYNTYAPQIYYCEKVRRNKKDKNILEVKCTYCGKWYIPNSNSIQNRIKAINGKIKHSEGAEHRLYCSNECKKACPIYKKVLYQDGHPKLDENLYSREVQSELRQMVFERDNYTCLKCGNQKTLHCHHIEGICWEPLESADIDKCMTVCKTCHKEIHQQEDCGYHDMRCKTGDIIK